MVSFDVFAIDNRTSVQTCPPSDAKFAFLRAFRDAFFHAIPFRIRTSETPLPQLLYNLHLQTPLGSAGNKGLITPLESALTRNSPVTSLESALTKTGGWDAISKENFNFPAPHYSQGRKGTRITPCGRRRCQRVQNHKRDAGRKDPSRGLSG